MYKKQIIIYIVLFFSLFLSLSLSLSATSRTIINIDFDWYFHPNDMENGEKNIVDYHSWRKLDLPHDWSIEREYSKDNRRENAFLPGGVCWYKKEIDWNDDWTDKLVFIDFEGAYMNSTVWLNGEKLGYYPNGYLGFRYDLTPFLKKEKNILTVKLDNDSLPSARWYSGTGIYRHVNLLVCNKIHVAQNGVWVHTSNIDENKAAVFIETNLNNSTDDEKVNVKVTAIIKDNAGKEIGRNTKDGQIKCKEGFIRDTLTIINPKLWSIENPTMYALETVVEHNGQVLDNYTTPFGIRTLEYDSKLGFKLNGVVTKLKGVCLHQNMGAAGSALTDEMWHKRLAQLKEMGCNAIRTSHYPYAPEVYTMCDTMGIMVLDEPWDGWYQWGNTGKVAYDYGHYFLDWWEYDLQEFIKRDRNHPCVVMWSAGNEVWGWDKHLYLQWKIVDTYHKMDPTRPVTQAYALGESIDIAGFNGNGEDRGNLEKFHKEQPEKLGVGTEIPHSRATRGVYFTIGAYRGGVDFEDIADEARKNLFPVDSYTSKELFPEFDRNYASGYDNQTRRISIREQWKQTRDNNFFIGEFRWTGFDYLGESWGWPARTNNYGVIDLAGFPKDAYYLYQSLWTDKPMIHLLPHWTWPGREGVEIPVVVYTNGDSAELFLNGKSLGRKTMDPNVLQIIWMVPYKSGTLTAIAYKNGEKTVSESVSTASKPAGIKLSADRMTMKANRRDVVYITADIMDSKGTFVPYANNEITFDVKGSYKLIGVENGDILDVNPQKVLNRKTFMGKALLILQATDQKGTLIVQANSPSLKSSILRIICK